MASIPSHLHISAHEPKALPAPYLAAKSSAFLSVLLELAASSAFGEFFNARAVELAMEPVPTKPQRMGCAFSSAC